MSWKLAVMLLNWRAGTCIFIDVPPRVAKPANLPAGTIWRDKPRLNIPGSVWLPDTGYGKLPEPTEHYLQRGLEQASLGNKAALIVIYCQHHCWMSWNAAKRVRSYGYSKWPGPPREPKIGSAPSCLSPRHSRSRGPMRRGRNNLVQGRE